MNQEEIKQNEVVKICYKYLKNFIDIYQKDKDCENKMPENVKITVYCKGSGEEGFLINMKLNELGFEALIAKKWIIHSELESLAGSELN